MGAWASRFESSEASPCLIDRTTGKPTEEPLTLNESIRFYLLYKTWFGRALLELPITWWVLGVEHKWVASQAASPSSKKQIPGLIKDYQINTDDSERPVEDYETLQEFFTRRLKPGSRPLASPDDPRVAVQPADSRVVVYPSITEARTLWIKGRHFSMRGLVGPGFEPDYWGNAALAINRLAPQDCHRIYAPVTGRVVKITRIGNRFMTSEWVSVHSPLDVLTENERLVIEYHTDEFGTVVQVPVGANSVGAVQPLIKEGQHITKGDEVALFAFGGSIMVTLFPEGAITFDQDLVDHSERGWETKVNLGMSLGRATGAAPAPAGVQSE